MARTCVSPIMVARSNAILLCSVAQLGAVGGPPVRFHYRWAADQDRVDSPTRAHSRMSGWDVGRRAIMRAWACSPSGYGRHAGGAPLQCRDRTVRHTARKIRRDGDSAGATTVVVGTRLAAHGELFRIRRSPPSL